MNGCDTDVMFQRAENAEAFQNFRVLKQFGAEKALFPLPKPTVIFACEWPEELHFLLGYEDGVWGRELMIVSVLSDERMGGGFCEECARQVCEAVLSLDAEKLITGVRVDKLMYDRVNAAYKVMMRFSLRERCQCEEAVV